jgi:hypothetical protein
MTLTEYNQRFGKTIQDLQTRAAGDIMVRIGAEALTFIKHRVQETGINAEGQKFAPYSTKPMLIGSKSFPTKAVGDKLFGSKAKRKELEWRTLGEGEGAKRLAILQGGYRQWRTLMGRQVQYIDFSVSNNMWNDINVISKQSDHQRGIAIIGARKDSEKKKLEGNTARRGDILDLNKWELDDLSRLYGLGTIKVFKENGIS